MHPPTPFRPRKMRACTRPSHRHQARNGKAQASKFAASISGEGSDGRNRTRRATPISCSTTNEASIAWPPSAAISQPSSPQVNSPAGTACRHTMHVLRFVHDFDQNLNKNLDQNLDRNLVRNSMPPAPPM